MISIYAKLFDLLDAREQLRFYLLLGLIVVNGVVEMVGVASVLPFLAVLADPGIVAKHRLLSMTYEGLGFQSDLSFQIFLGLVVLAIVIFGLVVRMGTLYALSRFSQMRSYSISTRLLANFLYQPYVWFLNRHSADLAKSILFEVDKVVGEAMIPAMRILAQTVSLLCLIVLLFLVNPSVALAATLLFCGLYIVIFLFVRRLLTRLGQLRADANRARYKVAQEAMGGVKDVKLLGLEDSYIARFRAPARRFATTASTGMVVGEAPRYLLEAIAFGGMVLLVLTLLVQGTGDLSAILPTLGVFAFAGLKMFPALQQIYNSLTKMRFVGPMLDNVHRDMMQTRVEPVVSVATPRAPLRLREHLDLLDVHYAYPQADRLALRGLNLKIMANTTVGIVGGTGAGKTTAVDIILGLLRPDEGELKVDGVPVTTQNLRSWQDVLGYVPQQIFLIDDTVAANIAFGIPLEKRDQAAIERAAELAELHGFVTKEMPKGYDTTVGERGVRLSGGQRQRIGIARALYHDPDVLILDEATSALDNLTERAVMDAVHNLGRKKTIIMIAHRLTTIRNCDRIFLMEKGKVSAEGTYDELIADSEAFSRMAQVDMQSTPRAARISQAPPSGGA
jgi:ABC-type multidrug transport system fused ATPase/permease subunit